MAQNCLDRCPRTPDRIGRTLPSALCWLWLLLTASSALAEPGDLLLQDDFESGFRNWSTDDALLSGINSMTANSPSNSMYLRGDEVTTTSRFIDTRVPAIRIEAWIRRGDDAFSADTKKKEDLEVEYLDANGDWILLATYLGDGDPGERLTLDETLSSDALHAGFRLRFHLLKGGKEPKKNDEIGKTYWHIDDFTITEVEPPPPLVPGACEEFEEGLGNWTITSTNGLARLGSHSANTPTHSLAMSGGGVTATLNPIDLSLAWDLGMNVWIRRGDKDFSDGPGKDEDLFVEYLDASGNWNELANYDGDGSEGQIYTPSFALPAEAAHEKFSVRFRMTGDKKVDKSFWHVDSLCLTGVGAVADWRFDEASWNGTPAEVVDSSGNGHDGIAIGDTDTSVATPALPGNPGTCGYGVFDGDGDGIDIPHDDALNGLGSLTYTGWISPTRSDGMRHVFGKTIARSRAQYSQMGVFVVDGRLVAGAMTTEGAHILQTRLPAIGQWTHVALVFDGSRLDLYLDGSVAGSATFRPTTLVQSTTAFTIGKEPGSTARSFAGSIDEVRVYRTALTQPQVERVMKDSRPCSVAAVEFLIEHDGNGVHCAPEVIQVTARDTSGNPLTSYAGSVSLDTQTGTGSWTLVAGDGLMEDATPDDGLARYTYSASDAGVARFALDYTSGPSTLNIDAFDGAYRDDDSEGDITFEPSAYTITGTRLPNPPPSPIDAALGNQVAGQLFEIHLAAYGTSPSNPSCGIIESYTGPKPVRFWVEHGDPATAPLVPAINDLSIADSQGLATPQTVVFTDGQAVVNARYKDVGRIAIAALDESGVTTISGSTGSFVSRPADFAIVAIRNAAGDANPGAATPAGDFFARAGEPFFVRVEVRDSQGSLTPSYGRESNPEGLRLRSAALIAPAGGRNGTADDGQIENGSAFAAASPAGTFESGRFAFDEVGAIELETNVADADYLGTGDVAGTRSNVVGRFAPSRFELTANTPSWQTACNLGAFTWLDQPFDYVSGSEPVITVRAANAAGGTTRNYAGDWWRITNDSLANRRYAVSPGALDESGLPPTTDDPEILPDGGGVGRLRFSSGSGLVVARQVPTAPFEAEISLEIDVRDEDGTAYASNPFRFGSTASGSGMAFDVSKRFQYGRLRIDNAHGSELVDLSVPLRAQRFDGITFVDDGNDSCTRIEADHLTLAPAPGSLTTTPNLANAPLLLGDAGLSLDAPVETGSVDITVDLGPTGANVPWLRYDWPDDGGLDGLLDDDPRARATFGIWRGRDHVIFTREVY